MITVTETTVIHRAPADVFDFFADGSNRPRWDLSVVSEELTSPGPIEAGSTMRTVMRIMGREVEFQWRVERLERPVLMAASSTSGPLETSFAFSFTDVDGGSCEVRAGIKAEPTGVMRFVEPMITEAVRSQLATGLGRAKGLLEARGG